MRASLATPDDAQAAPSRKSSSGCGPTSCCCRSSTTTRRANRCARSRPTTSARSQNGQAPLEFRYTFSAESNTGVPSGFDFDNDGTVAGGADALGFGEFPGQYAMALFSRFPIDAPMRARSANSCGATCRARSCPTGSRRRSPWTGIRPRSSRCCRCRRRATGTCRVKIGGRTLHLLASHPTPPAFDGRRIATDCATTTRSASGATTIAARNTSATTAGRRGGLRRRPFHHHGRSELGSRRRRQPASTPSSALLAHPRVDSALHPGQRRRRGSDRRRRVGSNATHARRSAQRHRGLQRPRRRQPARGLSTAFEGPAGLRRRRVLADAVGARVAPGVGRPAGTQLRSPAGLDRRQRRPSSMPTGQ